MENSKRNDMKITHTLQNPPAWLPKDDRQNFRKSNRGLLGWARMRSSSIRAHPSNPRLKISDASSAGDAQILSAPEGSFRSFGSPIMRFVRLLLAVSLLS